ncbi:MAG: hypothetical protein HJJLKODD_01505 [Phycisphaerae bacterium]|nr:hypothetical protein [Phycisphaerae bacterium]
MKKIIPAMVLVALGIIAYLVWTQQRYQPLVVSGFIEAEEVRVGSRIGGRVAEVFVDEGQQVSAGTRLFQLDPFDLQERSARAKAELAARQAQWQRMQAGYRKEEIEQARAQRDRAVALLAKLEAGPRPAETEIARQQLKQAQADLEFARSEYTRISDLAKEGRSAQQEIDNATRMLKSSEAAAASAEQQLALLVEGSRKEDIAEARAALASAEQSLQLLLAGNRAEDIAQAQAQVQAGEAEAAIIERQITELQVTSPCDCTVEAFDLEAGDLVAVNAPAVALLDLSRLWVRAYVPENRLGQIHLGQQVTLQVDSFPGEQFTGEIVFIAREAEFTPRNIQTPEERSKQVFRIKVNLTGVHDKIRVGMAADVFLESDH